MQYLRDCRKKKRDEITVAIPAPKEEPKEAAKAEPPKIETPKIEIPKVEASKEAPKIEEVKADPVELKKNFRSTFFDDDLAETKNELKQMKAMLQNLHSTLQPKKEEPKVEPPKPVVPQKFIYTGVYGGFKPY